MKKQRPQKLVKLFKSEEEEPPSQEINYDRTRTFSHLNGGSHLSSPHIESPWAVPSTTLDSNLEPVNCGHAVFITSLVREEGHVYSLAVSNGFLFSGSDSKNIRVWKNLHALSGFKSGSGFVKAIIASSGRIFTGHHDGKIRVWDMTINDQDKSNETVSFSRTSTIPSLTNEIKLLLNPKHYAQVDGKKRVLKIKHCDAVSCMGVVESDEILYSGSWDKTVKVWSLSKGFKLQESIEAHKDAVNTLATGFGSIVFTGSADGTVKAWKREYNEKGTKHKMVRTLLTGAQAVTGIVVDHEAGLVYASTSDGMIHFWGEENCFKHMGVLRAQKVAVLCLAAVSGFVVCGGADGTVWVWWRKLGGCHVLGSVLEGHSGPVKCLAVEGTEDGCVVYSGSLDRSIRVWKVLCDQPSDDALRG